MLYGCVSATFKIYLKTIADCTTVRFNISVDEYTVTLLIVRELGVGEIKGKKCFIVHKAHSPANSALLTTKRALTVQ